MPLRAEIFAAFPGLVAADCLQTSDVSRRYNCIAHAAGEEKRWWWPVGPDGRGASPMMPLPYWPPGAPRALTLEAFEVAFSTLGYQRCESDALEPGVEKVAIFVASNGRPMHAARQLDDGGWTSKLGSSEDIRHVLRQVEGDAYGTVALLMARARQLRSVP
jgi:hypothetical protein